MDGVEKVVHLFKGCHDFASFTPKPIPIGERQSIRDSIKTILDFNFKQINDLNSITDMSYENDCKIRLISFEVKCKSFLYNQVCCHHFH